MDKISYALGLSLGQNMKSSGVKSLEYNDLVSGIRTIMEGSKPAIGFDEAQRVLDAFSPSWSRKQLVLPKRPENIFWQRTPKEPALKPPAAVCNTR